MFTSEGSISHSLSLTRDSSMTLLRKFELESERHTQFSTEPFVLNFAPEVDIAAGGWHSTALTNDGEVYGWGRGEHGRLGFGNDKSSIMVPQEGSTSRRERYYSGVLWGHPFSCIDA